MPDTRAALPSRTEIAQRVRGIIAEQLSIAVTELPEYARWDEMGADSLDQVEVVMALEEAFDVELDWNDLEQHAATIGQLIDLVEGAVKAGGIA